MDALRTKLGKVGGASMWAWSDGCVCVGDQGCRGEGGRDAEQAV